MQKLSLKAGELVYSQVRARAYSRARGRQSNAAASLPLPPSPRLLFPFEGIPSASPRKIQYTAGCFSKIVSRSSRVS
eukprot:6199042-Pleurochrysis_carterae.AAC.1